MLIPVANLLGGGGLPPPVGSLPLSMDGGRLPVPGGAYAHLVEQSSNA